MIRTQEDLQQRSHEQDAQIQSILNQFDSLRLDAKVQREAGLYHDLGEAPPGWAIRMEPIRDNVHFKFQSLPPLDFDSTSFIHRVRHWIVLKSTGNSLEKCQSLSEVVGATYDILEGR